jgi:hypothetical protein
MKKCEFWKDILNYEKLYQVSNIGRVRSLDRLINGGGTQKLRKLKGRILTEGTTPNGYSKFSLSKEGKTTIVSGHRLVALVYYQS